MARKPDDEIKRLRQEAARQQRNAASKIRRLGDRGVSVRGTLYDPTKGGNAIGRMNRIQLKAYINKLAGFNARSTKFVGGAQGQPIPWAKWGEYKRLEAQVNMRAQRYAMEVGGVQLPNADETVAQRRARLNASAIRRAGGGDGRQLFPVNDRTATRIEGARALDDLIKQMDKRLQKNYAPKDTELLRGSVDRMLEVMGENDYRKDMASLTDYQFNILMRETDIMASLALKYDGHKKTSVNAQDWVWDRVQESENAQIGEGIEWAKRLKKP